MNSRYQSKRDQLEADNQRLQELTAEDNEITKQLSYEDNAVNRLRLERQQDDCRDKMNKLALKCDRLKNELQVLQAEEEALQILVNLLKLVRFEIVTKIYRSCLSQGRPRLVPDTLEALIRRLADIPGEPNEPEPLLCFISRLIQEPSLTAEQRESVKAWATKQGMSIQEEKSESSETTEVCLMIKVQPRAVNDPSLGYVVSASIAQDPDPWKPNVEPMTTPITISVIPDPTCTPGYSQDDLPRILNELIATCGETHCIPLTDLIIQWFLPIELMSLPVEHWQIQIGRSQKQCGVRCKAVIVRSYDRHFSPEYQLASGDWKKYWKRLLEYQESRCTETLVPLDPMTNKITINWKRTKVVGCKFVAHHEPQQQEALWDQLLGQGLPIALWMRQSGSDPEQAKKVMQSVTKCSIAGLSESLAGHRQKALSHDAETDRLKAASLCLLLDNPFRPFPTLDYQSA